MFEWILDVVAFLWPFLLAALLAVLVTVLLGDQIAILLTRMLGGAVPKPRRKVAGVWYSVFWFRGVSGEVGPRQNLVRIRAFAGRFSADSVAGDDHVIRFSGELRQGIYATGRWEHRSYDNLYHGSFHFILDPEGDRLHGRWLGFNKKQVVAVGPWILVRVSREVSRATVAAKVEAYSTDGLVELGLLPPVTQQTVQQVYSQQVEDDTSVNWAAPGLDL